MAVGQIVVSTEQVKAVAQKVDNLARNYKESYTELYNLIESMAEYGIWQGTDNDAFIQQITQFRNEFVAMEQLMISYADFLRKAADGYKTIQGNTTDQVGKKLVTSV